MLSTLRSLLLGSGLGLMLLSISSTIGLVHGWDLQGLAVLALPLPFGAFAGMLALGLASMISE